MFNPNLILKNAVEYPNIQAFGSLLARIFLAYIFIVSGWGKITAYEATAGYMQAMGVPASLLPLVILVELGGGLAIVLGFQARLAGLGLAVFSILSAFLFHTAPEEAVNFMKNFGLAGGFLYIMLYGAGKISLDHFFEKA